MKTAANFSLIFAVLVFFSACKTKQMYGIKKAEWLLGTWENRTAKGSIYETWGKENSNKYVGRSYAIKEEDTTVFENIQLVYEEDQLFYIPVVKNQNAGLAVRFQAKTISNTQLVFENPEHDFPQIISYTKITADSLVAEISGNKNGKEHKQTFPMKRTE